MRRDAAGAVKRGKELKEAGLKNAEQDQLPSCMVYPWNVFVDGAS